MTKGACEAKRAVKLGALERPVHSPCAGMATAQANSARFCLLLPSFAFFARKQMRRPNQETGGAELGFPADPEYRRENYSAA